MLAVATWTGYARSVSHGALYRIEHGEGITARVKDRTGSDALQQRLTYLLTSLLAVRAAPLQD